MVDGGFQSVDMYVANNTYAGAILKTGLWSNNYQFYYLKITLQILMLEHYILWVIHVIIKQ